MTKPLKTCIRGFKGYFSGKIKEIEDFLFPVGKINSINVYPLTREEGKGLFRLYLADERIFTNQSNVNRSDFFTKDSRNKLSGIFYENYVACELSAKDVELCYWCGKNQNEFEFIIGFIQYLFMQHLHLLKKLEV